jgi:SAM-dependent methyltransferase
VEGKAAPVNAPPAVDDAQAVAAQAGAISSVQDAVEPAAQAPQTKTQAPDTEASARQTESTAAQMEPCSEQARKAIERDALAEYIRGFSFHDPGEAAYVESHLTRLIHTLEIIPVGTAEDRILEMGAYMQITPALKTRLGYGEVRGSYLGKVGDFTEREVHSRHGESFACRIDHFNAEMDRYPYSDGFFSTVLCCELLEHLYDDPMHMMAELNRVLKTGGRLVLSTPNICSTRAVGAALLGYHPGLFHQYVRPDKDGAVDPRHAREYAPRDVHALLDAAGFSIVRLETGPYLESPSLDQEWVRKLLERHELSNHLRGDVIYAIGENAGPVKSRYPPELYTGAAE